MIQKILSLIVCFSLLGCNNGSIAAPVAASTSGNEDIYSPMPPRELTPLQSVPEVSVEQTTGPRPIVLRISNDPQNPTRFDVPYDGMFFSLPVASFIISEVLSLDERYNASLLSQREMDFERIRLIEEEWRLRLNGERERFRLIHNGDQQEIARLMRLTENTMQRANSFPWESVLTGAGGLLIGVVGGFIMGFLAVN